MHDLTCMLSGAAHCSLGAVSAALPCPGLPEERQLAEAQDHRTQHRPDSPSSRSQSEAHSACTAHVAILAVVSILRQGDACYAVNWQQQQQNCLWTSLTTGFAYPGTTACTYAGSPAACEKHAVGLPEHNDA